MIDRLGWTLVHFVWEGAVVAVLLTLVLLFGQRASAELRYGLALGALALMAALPVATFLALTPSSLIAVGPGALRPTLGETIMAGSPPEAKMPILVGLWCVGVAVLSLRLIGTVFHLERWRRRHAEPAPPGEQAKLDALARRIGLRRRVALLISPRIDVPSAWGVFRPVVVVPLGLLTGLPPVQVEGILLHELAHVRRYDYLVNLLQSLVETALFYHPAVWWVSSVVRREREHLCDDLAVATLGDPMPYARALLHLEERRQAPRPALSAKEGNLMNRIARVLAPKPVSPRISPLGPSLAAFAVVGLAFGGVLRAEAQAPKSSSKRNATKGKPGRRPSRRSSDWTPSLNPATGQWNDASRGVVTLSVPALRPRDADEPDPAQAPANDTTHPNATPARPVPAKTSATVPVTSAKGRTEVRRLDSTSAPTSDLPAIDTDLDARSETQRQAPSTKASPQQSVEAVVERVVAQANTPSQVAIDLDRGGQIDAQHRDDSIAGQASQAQGDAAFKAKQDAGKAKSTGHLEKIIAKRRATRVQANAELYQKVAEGKYQDLFKKEGQSYRFVVPKTYTLPKDIQGFKQLPNTPLYNPEEFRMLFQGNGTTRIYTRYGDPQVEVSSGGKVSVDARDASFVGVVRAFARKTKLSVVIAHGSYGDVSLVLNDRSPAEVMSILCKAAGATCRLEGGVYYVAPEGSARADVPRSVRTLVLNLEAGDVLIEGGRIVTTPIFETSDAAITMRLNKA